MKILHVCLGCFYIDNYSYQENMLPKYHKKLGYSVEILASTLSFDKNGERCFVPSGTYTNEYGIKVTRVNYKRGLFKKTHRFLRLFEDFMPVVESFKPSIIFIHGCQFLDIRKFVKYAKKNNITIYVDNHADFSNSARNFLSKNILHKGLWRFCAKKIEPYTKKFYGVLPARVDFLIDIYKIPQDKCKLLVMGADDDLVNKYNKLDIIENVKKKLKIDKNAFVIITGGKIDYAKTQILSLMKIINRLNNDNIQLIVFGSIIKELQKEFLNLLSDKIKYIGWLNSSEIYKYISISDLVIYPGRHSVLWEQTVAQGKPLVVKYWQGTTHIDIGGNVKYLYNDTDYEMEKCIISLIHNKKKYIAMKRNAISYKKDDFLYSNIAKNSLL